MKGHVMGKLFGLVSILVAMYVGMQIYTKGIEGMLGGATDPIESSERDSSSLAGHLIGDDVTMPTARASGADARDVRDSVKADVRRGAKRRRN